MRRLASTLALALAGCQQGPAAPAASPVPTTPGATAPAAPTAVSPAPALVAADAAPAIAPPKVRPDVVLPVVHVAGRHYMKLSAWAELAQPPLEEVDHWGGGPVEFHDLPTNDSKGVRLQRATAAPPSWRAAIGAPVAAYQADGTACSSAIVGLSLVSIGYDPGEATELNGDNDVVLAELGPMLPDAPACAPVLVTTGGPPRLHPPSSPGPASVARAVTAAFTRLPPYRKQQREWQPATPRLSWFQGPAGSTLVVAAVGGTHEIDGCQWISIGQWAVYEVAPGRPPRQLGEHRGGYGAAPVLALYERDGDGMLEAIIGLGKTYTGSDGATALVRYIAFPADASDDPDAPTELYDADVDPDLDFPYYIGCD